MIENFDTEVLAKLFSDAPDNDDSSVWIGQVFQFEVATEAIPFQFGELQYIMYFVSVSAFFEGDDDLVADTIEAWADGVSLAPEHRLVKFFRVGALNTPDTLFNPAHWKLADPRQIFQFSQLLIDVILVHARALTSVSQYLFKPENASLARFYTRTYRVHATCSEAGFTPILELSTNGGGFYGYARQ